jgi:hypothetical protein
MCECLFEREQGRQNVWMLSIIYFAQWVGEVGRIHHGKWVGRISFVLIL